MRRLFFLLICVFLPLNISAFFHPLSGWDLEVRAAAFYPPDKKFRHRYVNGWGAEYQAEVAKELFCDAYLWAGVGWFSRSGREGRKWGFKEKNHITVMPITFGIKQKFFLVPWVWVYFGLGASYAKVHFKRFDSSERINNWGGIFRCGVQYHIWCNLWADLFGDYVYQNLKISKSHHDHHKFNIGGYKIGVGLALLF